MRSMVEGHPRDGATPWSRTIPTVPLHHTSCGPPPPVGEDRGHMKTSGGQPGSMGPSHETRIARPERRFAAWRRGAARGGVANVCCSAVGRQPRQWPTGALSPPHRHFRPEPGSISTGSRRAATGRVRLKVETLPLAAWGHLYPRLHCRPCHMPRVPA